MHFLSPTWTDLPGKLQKLFHKLIWCVVLRKSLWNFSAAFAMQPKIWKSVWDTMTTSTVHKHGHHPAPPFEIYTLARYQPTRPLHGYNTKGKSTQTLEKGMSLSVIPSHSYKESNKKSKHHYHQLLWQYIYIYIYMLKTSLGCSAAYQKASKYCRIVTVSETHKEKPKTYMNKLVCTFTVLPGKKNDHRDYWTKGMK